MCSSFRRTVPMTWVALEGVEIILGMCTLL